MKFFRAITVLLFIVGVFLLGLNIIGLFIPLRNDAIYEEWVPAEPFGITLTEQEFYEAIERNDVSTEDYLYQLNDAVNAGIAQVWRDEVRKKYSLHIPMYENYILFILGYLGPNHYQKYEFCSMKKAIERGVGLCSQYVVVLRSLLNKAGISSQKVGLRGHIVAIAQVDTRKNTWWVLDPDYGVVIPHSLQEIEKNPSMVKSYYYERGHDASAVEKLPSIYAKDDENDNRSTSRLAPGALSCEAEYYFYIANWTIPLVLILPYLAFWAWRRRKQVQ